MVAEVLLDLPIEKTFYYSVSDVRNIKPLTRVIVEFKNEEKVGIVLNIFKENEINLDFKLKEIIEVLDESPIITDIHYEIAKMMKENYFCSLGEAFFHLYQRKKKKHNLNIVIIFLKMLLKV